MGVDLVARFFSHFFAEYTYRLFFISVNGLTKQRMSRRSGNPCTVFSDYFHFNAQIGPSLCNGKVKSFIQINNLFNVEYGDLLDLSNARRWFIPGINYGLSNQNIV
jgi:hypothetical protein